MRTLTTAIALLAAAGCNPPHEPSSLRLDTEMLVIGHRGASGYAPEHTFASWDRALELGADYLEQDLQMTSDGVLVVLHDDTLERTTGCTGRVIDRTWAEIRDCDAGSWFNTARPGHARPEFAGERIRTLDEVLTRYAGRASFYIETKNPEEAPGMEEALLDLLERHGLREAAAREWRVLVQSFSERSLRRMHALDPDLPLIQLLPRRWQTPRTVAAALDEIAQYAVGIGPHWSDVDEHVLEAARRHCVDVHPYTVNDADAMRHLTSLGVHGMFTDVPDVLLAQRPPDEPRGFGATARAAERNRACRAR